MDYSSLSNDPDHPAGPDPWKSSPQPNKTSFPPSESADLPSSPLGKHAPHFQEDQRDEDQEVNDEQSSPSSEQQLPAQPNGTAKNPTRSDSSSSPDIRFQGPPLTEEELRQQQLYQQRQQERYQQALHAQQHQRGPPNRYHPAARGPRQLPQYKLTTKISSLERTGKKDPAIRFDVHVRFPGEWPSIERKLTAVQDKSTQIPNYTS